MKHTIEGFSQKVAKSFNKKVLANGRKLTIKLDAIDLLILRWFADCFHEMKKYSKNDKDYVLVDYKSVIEHIPLLPITEIPFYKRLQKMVYFGILSQLSRENNDPLPYYSFGDKYTRLIKVP